MPSARCWRRRTTTASGGGPRRCAIRRFTKSPICWRQSSAIARRPVRGCWRAEGLDAEPRSTRKKARRKAKSKTESAGGVTFRMTRRRVRQNYLACAALPEEEPRAGIAARQRRRFYHLWGFILRRGPGEACGPLPMAQEKGARVYITSDYGKPFRLPNGKQSRQMAPGFRIGKAARCGALPAAHYSARERLTKTGERPMEWPPDLTATVRAFPWREVKK